MLQMKRLILASLCLLGAWDAHARVLIPREHSHLVEAITNSGRFYISVYQKSPLVAANFLRNVENGYYNGLQIHHMVPGFVLQFGDRRTIGQNNAEYPLHVTEGSYRSIQHLDLGMANLENGLPSDKQVVLFLRDSDEHRGEYSIFARVIKGGHVIGRLTKGDRIRQMRIVRYAAK
ncbi:MAG: peptidylprolyl isomerase [Alphaproteobacteria bacterium]|nr:peptidylprolyl isomerase [Alphaproteobacteria bacterium]